MLDCVMFHDGEAWQACVDTAASGDLSQASCMTDYKVGLAGHVCIYTAQCDRPDAAVAVLPWV